MDGADRNLPECTRDAGGTQRLTIPCTWSLLFAEDEFTDMDEVENIGGGW